MAVSRRSDPAHTDGLFRQLDEEFGFTVDAAASAENAKCARYFTRGDDALGRSWGGVGSVVWLNPPPLAGSVTAQHVYTATIRDDRVTGGKIVCGSSVSQAAADAAAALMLAAFNKTMATIAANRIR